MNYDDYQVRRAPSWLSDAAGIVWNRVLGTMKNAVTAATEAAVMCRFPSRAPLDALPVLLEDRQLDPPWNETESSVRARLKAAWATWTEAGRPKSLADALRLAGYTKFEILEQKDDPTLEWWEFEVRLYPPFPWVDQYLIDGRWDDPGVWDDGGVWAPDMPLPDMARVRQAVAKWPGTHTRCRGILVVHAGEAWDASAPPGQWDDDPNATWGDDVSYLAP